MATALGFSQSGCQVLRFLRIIDDEPSPVAQVLEEREAAAILASENGDALPDPVASLPMSPSATFGDTQLPAAFAAQPPALIHRPVPVFPAWTRIEEVAGSHAVFRITVDDTGSVEEAELVETTADANVEPARQALLQSRYRPVLSPSGIPVRATILERIDF